MSTSKFAVESISTDNKDLEKIALFDMDGTLCDYVTEFFHGAKVLKVATNKEYKDELLKFAGEDKKILGAHVTSRLSKKEIQFCTKDNVLVVKVVPRTKEIISFDLNLKQFEKLKVKATEETISVEDLAKKIVLKSL